MAQNQYAPYNSQQPYPYQQRPNQSQPPAQQPRHYDPTIQHAQYNPAQQAATSQQSYGVAPPYTTNYVQDTTQLQAYSQYPSGYPSPQTPSVPQASSYAPAPSTTQQYTYYPQQPQASFTAASSHVQVPSAAPNAYPSPVTPSQSSQSPSRRPLPNPSSLQRNGSIVTPERRSTLPSSTTSPVVTPSRFSHGSNTNSPRPLPTPNGSRSTKSLDLTRTPNAFKPGLDVLQESSPIQEAPDKDVLPPLQPGQKFVPLWKRSLPSPVKVPPNHNSPDKRGDPTRGSSSAFTFPNPSNSTPPLHRSQTTSGIRPLPPSPGPAASFNTDRSTNADSQGPTIVRTTTAPPSTTPTATPKRPQPIAVASPAQPIGTPGRRNGAASLPSSPSPFQLRDRSRAIPSQAPPPTGKLPSRPISMIKPMNGGNVDLGMSDSEDDDDDLSRNSLLNDPRRRSPSPTYGIRDLPSRSRTQLASENGSVFSASSAPSNRTSQSSSFSGQSQPPPPSPRSQPQQSAALRMAAMSIDETTSRTRDPSPTRGNRDEHGLPAMQRTYAQSQAGEREPRWPNDLPRLPRGPGLSQPQPSSQTQQPAYSSTRTSTASSSPSRQSSPTRSLPTAPSKSSSVSSYSLPPQSPKEKLVFPLPPTTTTLNGYMNNGGIGYNRQPPNLDDAPPVSLRRSPSPSRPTSNGSYPSTRDQPPQFQQRPQGELQYPPPSQQQYSQTPSQRQNPQRTHSQRALPPSPSHSRPPKISFPASPDDSDSDADVFTTSRGRPLPSQQQQTRSPQPPPQQHRQEPQPKIAISAPQPSAPIPGISINGFDSEDSNPAINVPSISIGGLEDDSNSNNDIPSISIGGEGPSISINGNGSGQQQQPIRRKPHELPMLPAIKGRGGLVCGGCGGAIIGRIVSAMGARWHPGCFRCCVCDELLENLSSYEHEGRPYCHLDYHEQFAPRCYHCQTTIVDEIFITLDDPELGKRTYHEQHFFCAECGDPFLPPSSSNKSRSFAGDGMFKVEGMDEEDVGFTVYKGHPYCEACHVRLRMPKCQRCKKSIRDGMRAVEALGGKWCWECFVCAGCQRPFEVPSFFQRDDQPYCEHCFSIIIKSEL